MSELFNALQKLEEQNATADDAPLQPPVSGGGAGGRGGKSFPYLKSIIFIALILVLAGMCLVFLRYQQDSSIFANITERISGIQQKKISKTSIHPAKDEPDITVIAGPDEDIVHGQKGYVATKMRDAKKAINEKSSTIVVHDIVVSIDGEDKLTHRKDKKETIEIVVDVNEVKQQSSKKEDLQEITKEQQQVARKRLLYRAEKLRAQGDYSRALRIYKDAWQEEPVPALANNIAAILINSHDFVEAEHFLRQALQLSPEDEDLRFNLEIAIQGQKKITSVGGQ